MDSRLRWARTRRDPDACRQYGSVSNAGHRWRVDLGYEVAATAFGAVAGRRAVSVGGIRFPV